MISLSKRDGENTDTSWYLFFCQSPDLCKERLGSYNHTIGIYLYILKVIGSFLLHGLSTARPLYQKIRGKFFLIEKKEGRKTMNMKPIIVSVIASMVISISANSATLIQSLSAYCVPSNASTCNGKERATFTGTSLTTDAFTRNYCQCGSCNMYYDKESRSCKECPAGTYVNDRLSTECISPVCNQGAYREITIGKDVCQPGYYRTVMSSCK